VTITTDPWSPREKPPPSWDIVLFDPLSGDELFLPVWTKIDITENFDGIEASIEVPGSRQELDVVTELVTDVLVYCQKALTFRLRVFILEDSLTGVAHTTKITARSYEAILQRRVLFEDINPDGSQVTDQHDIAWNLVSYTQGFESIGLTRKTGTSGQTRTRVIQKGQTIAEAINDVATTDNGFDWWVDEDLGFWMQTPRRIRTSDLDWMYGPQIQNIDRQGTAETYASVVMAIGATNPTTMPGGTVYPPPPPAIRELQTKPVGRWERVVSYSDIVTAQSVINKALWALDESAISRPSYKLTLAPSMYSKDYIHPGDVLLLRVRSLPRLNFKVHARIEEITINVDGNGAEVVQVAMRAEEPEQDMTGGGDVAPDPIILVEPFDDLDVWTIGTGGAITAGGQVGTMLRITGSSSRGYSIPPADQAAYVDVDFWWRCSNVGTASRIILQVRSDLVSANEITLQVDANGALVIRAGGLTGTVLGQTTNGFVASNTWYRLRLIVKMADVPNGTARLDVGGVTVINVTGVKTYLTTALAVLLNLNGGGTGVNHDFDELVLRNGPVPTGMALVAPHGEPQAGVIQPSPQVIPPGSVVVNPTAPSGRSKTVARTSFMGSFAAVLRDLETRVRREEHST